MAGKGNIANLIPWKPGQSGNPSGRRSDKPLVDYVLKSTRGGIELADALLDIARSAKKASDRIDAIQVLLDRCYGKVPSGDRLSLLPAGGGEVREIAVRLTFGNTERAIEEKAIDATATAIDGNDDHPTSDPAA